MWVTRTKEGELISISPRKEEAIDLAKKTHSLDEFIVQESLDKNELFEIYRAYYKTRSA